MRECCICICVYCYRLPSRSHSATLNTISSIIINDYQQQDGLGVLYTPIKLHPSTYMTLTFGSGTVYSCFYNFSRSVATRDQTLISGMQGKPALPTELMQWLVLEKNYHLNGSIVLSLFWWYLHLEKCVWHPSFQQIEVPFTPRIYI